MSDTVAKPSPGFGGPFRWAHALSLPADDLPLCTVPATSGLLGVQRGAKLKENQ